MTTAARLYADQYDAVWEQWQRLFGPQPDDMWAGPAAAQFRFDPRRELDANLAALASCVEPGDVLVDVGGGAGRVSLPLALRCQEVVTVEPSPAMAAEYAGWSRKRESPTRVCCLATGWKRTGWREMLLLRATLPTS